MRFALILFDIDHLKAYNDEHGHLAGDAALGRLDAALYLAKRVGRNRIAPDELSVAMQRQEMASAG